MKPNTSRRLPRLQLVLGFSNVQPCFDKDYKQERETERISDLKKVIKIKSSAVEEEYGTM